jgi:hypothetical protein
MRIALLILFFFIFPFYLYSQDTIYYYNGQIQTVKKEPFKYRTDYYLNGQIAFYRKSGNLFRKGKELTYSPDGKVISKGKIIFRYTKHGKWIFYENDTCILKNYKYGIDKKTLLTQKGKRKRCYLTYGKPRLIPCSDAREKYRCEFISVSGCIVNRNLVIKSTFHNLGVNIIQSFSYGFNWKKKAIKYCTEEE